MKKDLKALFQEYNSLSKSPQRTGLGRKIQTEKKRLVDMKDYVEIIHILRFMGDYEKDRLFLELLKQHPNSSLFVLAFANSEMNSYEQAHMIETLEHDHNEEVLQKDIELTFDNVLCKFLSEHHTKDDLEYVHELTDGASWLEAYKETTNKLSQL